MLTRKSPPLHVMQFQRDQVQAGLLGPLGEPLDLDGDFGPKTAWAVTMRLQHPSRQAMVDRALHCVGRAEEPLGSNRSEWIDWLLRRCGVWVPDDDRAMPGNAWCAAFVSWCLSVDGQPEVKRARVRDLVELYPSIDFGETLPGDLGYELRPDGTGHVWMLHGRDDRARTTMNVEGNTGNACRVTIRGVAKYLRTVDPAGMPGVIAGIQPAGSATR
jgi:hypothetical protein